MDGIATVGGVFLGFLIRIGIPISLTILLSWLLRKLDAQWRDEAIGYKSEAISKAEQDIYFTIWSRNPCWEVKNCSPEDRARCKAYLQAEKPCWEVFRVNGSYSKSCAQCQYHKESLIKIEEFEIKQER
jgi:hypothetical protein